MITIWTSTDDETFEDVVQKMMQKVGTGIEYRKVSFDGTLYEPGKRECVLAMGGSVLKVMNAEGVVPKKTKTVPSTRGKIFPRGKGLYMTTYDPGILLIDIAKKPQIQWDMRLIERVHRTGSMAPEIGDYEWVDDFSETVQYIKDKYEHTGKRVDVAMDTETGGLVPQAKRPIVTIQFSVEEGQAQVCYLLDKTKKQMRQIREQVEWLLNSDMISLKGANLKYDLVWVREKWGILCTNFRFDTLLAGSLLNENRSNSLKGHVSEYTQLGGYEMEFESKYDKSEMDKIPQDTPSFLVYTGGDTDGCLRVSNVMRKELKDNRTLQHFYTKILHPVSRVFEEIEYHGVEIDMKQFTKVRQKVQADVDECVQRLIDMMPRRLKLKHYDETKENGGLLVPKVLREFLFTKHGLGLKPQMLTAKTQEPTISYDHLMLFRSNPDAKEFIEVYKQMSGSSKTLSTFIDGFLKHRRDDGKLHPTFALFNGDIFGSGKEKDDAGTDTGRFSTKDPSIHILPKHTRWAKDLRSCYVAPPGWVLFQVDFNEGELRVAADLSGDETMLKSYQKGISLHAKTASALSLMPLDEYMKLKEVDKQRYDSLRRHAKSCNFGYIYGLQAEGFREYARTSFDLELSIEEAEANRETFFDTYPRLIGWHNRYVNMAHADQQVVSPLGRIRHLPLIKSKFWSIRAKQERRAINAPVQSTLSDMCAWGIVHIRRRFDMQQVRLAGMTHDSIWGYIPENHVLERLKEIKYIIESLPFERDFGWKPKVKFIIDADISPTNLAELKDVSFDEVSKKVA